MSEFGPDRGLQRLSSGATDVRSDSPTFVLWRTELWSQFVFALSLGGLGLLELLYRRPSRILLLVLAVVMFVAVVVILRRRRTIAPDPPPTPTYSLEKPFQTAARAAAALWRVGIFVVIGLFTAYGGAASLAVGFALAVLSLANLAYLIRFESRERVTVLRGGELDWVRPGRERRPAYAVARAVK